MIPLKLLGVEKLFDHSSKRLCDSNIPKTCSYNGSRPTMLLILFIILVAEPVVESKLHEARKMITNEKIELFNSIAGEML